MGDKSYYQFQVQGRFIGFEPHHDGKLKYFRLETEEGELLIKLAKHLRFLIGPRLTVGDTIEVFGEKTVKPYKGTVKWEAWAVTILASDPQAQATALASEPRVYPTVPHPIEATQPTRLPRKCVQICQKSDCQKRGASRIANTLQQLLADHPEHDQIQIKSMGCMKNCKAGPNVVFMPDKARYSHLQPQDLPSLVTKHFPAAQ